MYAFKGRCINVYFDILRAFYKKYNTIEWEKYISKGKIYKFVNCIYSHRHKFKSQYVFKNIECFHTKYKNSKQITDWTM